MSGMVIVGGGQAGYSVSHKLRLMGFRGTITIVCSEQNYPYQRPPLSKKFLMGELSKERLFFKPDYFYKENAISIKLGVTVLEIDRQSKKVTCSDNTCLSYEKLFLVTGSEPIVFPESLGGNLSRKYYIRALDDIRIIRKEFKSGKRVLIIGGGYIGLEIAAAARKKNLQVVLVESQERILKRVACLQTATFFKNLHEKNGVRVIQGQSIVKLIGNNDVFAGAVLDSGEELTADFCVIGIGVKPCTDLAHNSGLNINNGILVDSFCRTSDQNIFAAGDCANFPHDSGRLRLESVGNAIEQADVAALNALGHQREYNAKPWFWSDQYDTKLQIAGLSSGYDKVVERKYKNSFSMWYFKEQKLIAVDAINDAKAYMVAKKLIAQNQSPEESSILDQNLDLKLLLKSN